MFSVVVLCVAALCMPALCMPAQAQLLWCKEDGHCPDGYYCESDARIDICRECLSCEDLKREPPLAINTCIKSVAECGACINELVVDVHSDDLNAQCVKPDPSPAAHSYVWLIVCVVLLFSVFVFGIIMYLLRNPEIFKNVGSNPSSSVTACITTATAPEPPPPYNQLPPPTPYQHSSAFSDVERNAYGEAEQFIKPPPSRPQGTRESAGNQAARVYNRPRYDVTEPPSAESPVAGYTESMTLPVDQDEETMPSFWMPGTISNADVNANVVNDNSANESEGAAAALPALLAAARDTTLVEHSTAKRKCVRQGRQDSRESNSDESNDSSFQRPPSPVQGGNPYTSFITQITNVVQFNTNK